MQRPDDNEATVAERLRVYDEKTRPLIDFYNARGLLRVIDAQGNLDVVTRRLAQALGVPALRSAPRAKRPGAAKRPAGKRAASAKTVRKGTPAAAARKRAAAAAHAARKPRRAAAKGRPRRAKRR